MGHALSIIAIAIIDAVLGYFVLREVRRGEFRRFGMNGWFSRKDHPRDYVFHVACHLVMFFEILWALVWTLIGKR
jgi:hypothetical protein